MTRIIQGVNNFRDNVFGPKQSLFEQLRDGQRPLALFITCADSRIDPNLLTQTEPGELFVQRNAGNLIPPFGSPANGEAAGIEYAVQHLAVRDIIVCGHSQCGAMQGVMNLAALGTMKSVADWLQFASPCVERARARLPNATATELFQAVIEQNILVQIEHLKTYPLVHEEAAAHRLRLHAWIYQFEHGEVLAYDANEDRFVSLPATTRHKLLVPMDPAEMTPDLRGS
jgi:carbonic anhydrase